MAGKHSPNLDAVSKHVALRPQKRDGLLGTGKWGMGGGGGVKSEWLVCANRPSKDRGGRGSPPEQQLYLKPVGTSPERSN